MTAGPRSDRFGILVAVLGGLLVALVTALVIVLLSQDGGNPTTTSVPVFTTAPSSTSALETTTTSGATTTVAPSTTAAATTTTAAPTTTTTTIPPFAGTLDPKTGPAVGSPSGTLLDLRGAPHDSFARVVFDFSAGGTPSYWVGYTDATHLQVILYPMSWAAPYAAGLFDAAGQHAIDAGAIATVDDGGMGAGSGEWVFEIVVTTQKPFLVEILADPPRLYVDVGN